ncbi:MAG: sugar ABC transporter permease [Anaerolineaceae bacterium]|nr:MAG: sugar ABC transporter permease [Anaerolineaceae bacterium]
MKKVLSSKQTIKRLSNVLFIAPLLVINITFFVIPFLKAIYMSLFDWKILGDKAFIGLTNYIQAFQNQKFINSLIFTGKYALLVTPMLFIVAFIMALLVNHTFKGVGIFRTIYFLPVIISMTTCANIWLWIYNELYGVLNYILMNIGLISKPIAWMKDASISLPAVCVMITWKMSGFTMLMLLAAFQAIDEQTYEAAKIDGANAVQKFFRITLPIIRPTIGLSMVISLIGSVLAFEQFRIMTKGGPSSSTQTTVFYIYETSFKNFKFGYGAAMSIILLVILAVLSYFQFKVMKDPSE